MFQSEAQFRPVLVCIGLFAILDLSPAQSIGKSKVAFLKGGDVFVSDLGDTGAVQVTKDGLAKFGLRWSPDGRALAFRSPTDRTKALGSFHVISEDGKQVRQYLFRPTQTPIAGMNWLEDIRWMGNSRVLLQGGVNTNNCEAVLMDLTTGKEVNSFVGLCGGFVVSPDGAHVALTCAPGVFAHEDDWRQCLDIDANRAYTPLEAKGRLMANPVWSPDSKSLAVLEHNIETKQKHIVIITPGVAPTLIPVTSNISMPATLHWMEKDLVLKSGADSYLVDSTVRAVRYGVMDREDELTKAGELARRAGAARARQLGAVRDEDVDVFVPGPLSR